MLFILSLLSVALSNHPVITKVTCEKKYKDIFDKYFGIRVGSTYEETKIERAVQQFSNMFSKNGNIMQVRPEVKKNSKGVQIDIKVINKHYTVDSIRFVGNKSISSRVLSKLLLTKPKSIYSSIFSYITGNHGKYTEKGIIHDTESIERYYFNEGYIDVKVHGNVEIINNKLVVSFEIDEGKKYKLGKTINVIPEIGNIKSFKEIKLKSIKAERILQKCVEYNFIKHENIADIEFHLVIYEDTRYIKRIRIVGNNQIDSSVVRDIIGVSEGDIVYGKKLKQIKARLKNNTIISDASVEIDGDILDIKIKEDPSYRRINLSISTAASVYNLDNKPHPSLNLSFFNKNIFNKEIYFSSVVSFSSKSTGLNVSFTNPNYTKNSLLSLSFNISDYADERVDINKLDAKVSANEVSGTVLRTFIMDNKTSHGIGLKFDFNHSTGKYFDQKRKNYTEFKTLEEYKTACKNSVSILSLFGTEYKTEHNNNIEKDSNSVSKLNNKDSILHPNILDVGRSARLSLISSSKYYNRNVYNDSELVLQSILEAPFISTRDTLGGKDGTYFVQAKESISFRKAIPGTKFDFHSVSNMNLTLSKGYIPHSVRVNNALQVIGFNKVIGPYYASDKYIGSRYFIRSRNGINRVIHSLSSISGIRTSLFSCIDLCTASVPRYNDAMLIGDEKMGSIRSSIGAGITLESSLITLSCGIAIPFSYNDSKIFRDREYNIKNSKYHIYDRKDNNFTEFFFMLGKIF